MKRMSRQLSHLLVCVAVCIPHLYSMHQGDDAYACVEWHNVSGYKRDQLSDATIAYIVRTGIDILGPEVSDIAIATTDDGDHVVLAMVLETHPSRTEETHPLQFPLPTELYA